MLCRLSLVAARGDYSLAVVQAFRGCGFSWYRAWALGRTAFSSCGVRALERGLSSCGSQACCASWHVESSQIMAWTRGSCIGRRISYCRVPREASEWSFRSESITVTLLSQSDLLAGIYQNTFLLQHLDTCSFSGTLFLEPSWQPSVLLQDLVLTSCQGGAPSLVPVVPVGATQPSPLTSGPAGHSLEVLENHEEPGWELHQAEPLSHFIPAWNSTLDNTWPFRERWKLGLWWISVCILKIHYIFIWLCWVSVVACKIFDLCCGTWDLVLLPGIKPGPLALGVQS